MMTISYLDYMNASRAILDKTKCTNKLIRKGDISSFNLSGYDVVNSTIIGGNNVPILLFDYKNIWFNSVAIKLIDSEYVELLFDPIDAVIAIRKSGQYQLNTLRWRRIDNKEKIVNKKIRSKGFLFMLFEEFGWDISKNYKIRGHRREKDGESVLFFNITSIESEYFEDYVDENGVEMRKRIRIVNPDYINRFGMDFYEREHETKMYLLDIMKRWNIESELVESADTEDFIKESKVLVDGYINKLLDKESQKEE